MHSMVNTEGPIKMASQRNKRGEVGCPGRMTVVGDVGSDVLAHLHRLHHSRKTAVQCEWGRRGWEVGCVW